ncbi:Rib/alpha-like domain-containing protein, partial [Hutsoniella sourekii]
MKIGDAPIIGHLGIYPGTTGARGVYNRYDFQISGDKKTYTYTMPYDIKVPAGTDIKLYTGQGGDLVDNRAEIYINGTKVAEVNPGQAETSFAPRVLIGTESQSSALLDRTQYMPTLFDMYDTDKVITGYTYQPDQMVEIVYIDANSGERKTVTTFSKDTAEPGASYTSLGKQYPEAGKGLYKFEYIIPENERVTKDSPLLARSYNYRSSGVDRERALKEGEEAIRTSVGSDAAIGRVLIRVDFDLNLGSGTAARMMTYAAPRTETDSQGNTTEIESTDVPKSDDFSTETGYQNGGLGNNMAEDPVRDGYRFLGWNTEANGLGDWVTAETPLENSTTLYAQWEKIPMNEEFEPGYDNISVKEGEAGRIAAPTFVKEGQVANPTVKNFQTTLMTGDVTLNDDGSISISAEKTAGRSGETIAVPVIVTYSDNSRDFLTAYITITAKDSEIYEPTYPDANTESGTTTPVKVNPTFYKETLVDPSDPNSDKNREKVTPPAGTTFTFEDGSVSWEDSNTGDKATIDSNTGEVSFIPGPNSPENRQVSIPVKVTYPDGSEDDTNVTISVEKDNDSISASNSAVVSESQSISAAIETSQSQSTSAVIESSQSESAVVSQSQSESAVVSGSQSDSAVVSASQSESTVVSESQSKSESVSASQSDSAVVSESQSESAVVSESQSTSASVSASQSDSAVVSESQSTSASVSASQSDSAVVSESQSTSASVSASQSESAVVSESQS